MGKHRRLTSIEILLILAILAILVVWLFPRFLKTLDSHSFAIGTAQPQIGDTTGLTGFNRFPAKQFRHTGSCLSDSRFSPIPLAGQSNQLTILARFLDPPIVVSGSKQES